MKGKSKNSLITLMLALITSGILSGVVLGNFGGAFGSYWFPGLIFGLLFASATFDNKKATYSFGILSGLIYFLAVQISLVFSFTTILQELGIVGLLAGSFGGIALSLAFWLFAKIRISLLSHIRTLIIGGIAGIIFFKVEDMVGSVFEISYNSTLSSSIPVIIAFTIWQVAVGISLRADIHTQNPFNISINMNIFRISPATRTKLQKFVQHPIVQLVGVITLIFSIIYFFMK